MPNEPKKPGEFYISTATESETRAKAVLPTRGSEDAAHLLHRWDVAPRGDDKSERDYLPSSKVNWIIHLDFPPSNVLKKDKIRAAFSPDWGKEYGRPTLFGYSPETNRWTFVNAAGVPETFSKLQIAWRLRALQSDGTIGRSKLAGYLAAASEAGAMLNASSVRADISPAEGARRSAQLLELVRECDHHVDVVLRSPNDAGFDGRAIWDTMLSLGLRWGDMDLFHWNNPGLPGDDHLFSVCTSTPPGYFLPERIAQGKVRTVDLVFGFSLPRTWEPVTVAQSMLKAVDYTRSKLGGTVLDASGVNLSPKEFLQDIRATTGRLTAEGFPPGSPDACFLF